MKKNSLIYLRGLRSPIVVSKKEAESVQDDFNDSEKKSDYAFNVSNVLFKKGDIKYVMILPDGSQSENFNATVHQENVEGWKERQSFLRQSPEAKSKCLDMFFYGFKFSTGREPTAFELKKAELAQLEFYRANPNRTLCDFNVVLSQVVPPNERLKKINRFELGYFRFLENALLTDMSLSNKKYDE